MGWFGRNPERDSEDYCVVSGENAAVAKMQYPEERMFSKKELLDIICDALDVRKFNYYRNEEKELVEMSVALNACRRLSNVRVTMIPDDNAIMIYAICPLRADESERMAVMEYITRANYGMRVGNFEMDMRSGEVKYKVYLQMHSDIPPITLVERNIALTYLMIDRYGNGLINVMFGVSTPEEAIKAAEGD